MIISEADYLKHYGTPRHSGRYPWGSGENPYQGNASFLSMEKDLRKEGMTESQIAEAMGLKSTTELRAKKSIAKNANKQADIAQAQRLKDKGYSNRAIAERMELAGESSVRSLLKPGAIHNAQILDSTARMLKDQVTQKGYLDVGAGVERNIPIDAGSTQVVGVSRNRFDTAIAKLKEEGYTVHYVQVQQLGTGHMTNVQVLTGPDVDYKDVMRNRDKIRLITEHPDGGGNNTLLGIKPPISIDSSRIAINYSEKNSKGDEIGGGLADGVIYVRPGVEDVSLGASKYAQVRIAVDDTHFLKGMAVYKSDLPPGVDLVFNSNKTRAEAPNKLDAMKPMKADKDGNIDRDNPFGATIKPGGQNGVMNVIYEEGTWETWSKTLSSQFLSKQSPKLAEQQLNMTFERKTEEFEEIMGLTNPPVRRHLLNGFAADVDASAVHLKAAALPRQASHVLLPVASIKPTEIYAPNHTNGDRVVLIRFPHGGVFELPELTVNNKNREARKVIGTSAPDAVGIHPSVAKKLSGADFDGDTVIVIRNNNGQVRTAPSLEGLKDFDPARDYPKYEGMKVMSNTQHQMGNISNLITDMTIKGATNNELARAVRHSMVVIDAEKKELNYKLSAEVNGIAALKAKYQEPPGFGASTLVSRKKSVAYVPERKMGFKVDPETGRKIYTKTGRSYVDRKTGKLVVKKDRVNKLAETDDAHTLSSGTPIEDVYANHSNRLKDLANTARREAVAVKNTPYSPSAREAYREEVTALNAKLNVALMNAPRERQAQVVGNAIVRQKQAANPDMDYDELKKLRSQALAEARSRTGANKTLVTITPSEWDAIQAGAISNYNLTQILENTDLDEVKKLATPRSAPAMTPIKATRARGMAASGFTQAEIAEALGVSVSTIRNLLSEGG